MKKKMTREKRSNDALLIIFFSWALFSLSTFFFSFSKLSTFFSLFSNSDSRPRRALRRASRPSRSSRRSSVSDRRLRVLLLLRVTSSAAALSTDDDAFLFLALAPSLHRRSVAKQQAEEPRRQDQEPGEHRAEAVEDGTTHLPEGVDVVEREVGDDHRQRCRRNRPAQKRRGPRRMRAVRGCRDRSEDHGKRRKEQNEPRPPERLRTRDLRVRPDLRELRVLRDRRVAVARALAARQTAKGDDEPGEREENERPN